MGHLVHVVAPPMRAAGVIRTRCAWCGALIDEVDLDRIAWQVEPGEEDRNPFIEENGTPLVRWEGLVAVEEHGPDDAIAMVAKWAVPDPEDGKMPEDSCMALDPAVTS
jgi:hypothetical protein